MKKWEFTHGQKYWDRYKAFYADNGIFTEFETGELVIKRDPKPDARKYYEKYGLKIVRSTDSGMPQLYLDPTCRQPIKKAWLNHNGSVLMAIDTQHGDVYPFGGYYYNAPHTQTQEHLRGYLTWTRYDRKPTTNGEFRIWTPAPERRKEFYPKWKELKAAAQAIVKLERNPDKYICADDKVTRPPLRWLDMEVTEILAEIKEADDNIGFRWTTRQMRRIADNGLGVTGDIVSQQQLYCKRA